MNDTGGGVDRRAPADQDISACAAYEGGTGCIVQARDMAAGFLARVQAVHGLPVSARAMEAVRLVVSELVTNAVKHAPGPLLLELRVREGAVEVTVWDSDPVLPVARAADPGRVGQHGLEIVTALSRAYQVRREPVGKRITALVALADDPGGHRAGHQPLHPA
ncbi:ATP-binding protein [Streptomyces capparidis]